MDSILRLAFEELFGYCSEDQFWIETETFYFIIELKLKIELSVNLADWNGAIFERIQQFTTEIIEITGRLVIQRFIAFWK